MPFQISSDPRFLWLGEKHKEALAVLKYGVQNNQGFLLLTGDVGTGKTTLINALVNSLDSDTVVVNVTDPRLDKLDFFKLVAHSLGLEARIRTKFDFITSFGNFLHQAHEDQKRVLLIIDEAQKLSLDSLEEIRLLSNIERQETKLLNIFFVGQDEFNDTITQSECRALRQRITIVHHIEPLNEKETAEYVNYRLDMAGTQRAIFTDRALKEIYRFSRGYPRLINIICDRALLVGYTDDLQTIPPKIIRECVRDLSVPGEAGGQQTLKEAFRRLGPSIRRLPKTAGLPFLVLLIVFFGYIIASRFLGKPIGSLFGPTDPSQTRSASGTAETLKPSHSSPSTDLPAQPPREITSKPTGQEGKMQGTGSPRPVGSKWVIPFEYDTNELPPESLARLDELSGQLLLKTDLNIVIKGYTDSIGSAEYNRNLSAFRANVVKSYLAGKGIDPTHIKVVGMGDAAPLKPNTTSEGRSANRRVEIEVEARKP
jgi:general secretion pathway protein A